MLSEAPVPRFVLAVTGASGMPYAVRLAEQLAAAGELHCILSPAARVVLDREHHSGPEALTRHAVRVHEPDNIAAGPASGSWRHDGMIVCPCSMNSLAAIAHGLAGNLIHRAADVTIKERRKLILVVRETPYSAIHLENMLAATRAGAVVLPASPGFYQRPASVSELVDFVVGRILGQLGLRQNITPAWPTSQDSSD